MINPFTITFGKQPPEFISRIEQTERIIEAFTAEIPTTQIFMVTGVRGSGKTVMLTSVSKELMSRKDWIVVELNPETDLLFGLASKLFTIPSLHRLFLKAKLDLSLFGIGLSIEDSTPISNIESGIDLMLKELKKKKKRLLVVIDEASKSDHMRIFASAFQIFVRQDHDIFLIMSGLYENIYNLQNEKTLTFLYRAPKIMLQPLNMNAIASSYKEIFHLKPEGALAMARITKGYPFAFQVLGYLKWNDPEKDLEQLLPQFDQYLEEFVYDKIWHELSDKDRQVLNILADHGDTAVKVGEIRGSLAMSSSLFSTYRDKFEKQGLIDTSKYGYVGLILPRFSDFIKKRMIYWE